MQISLTNKTTHGTQETNEQKDLQKDNRPALSSLSDYIRFLYLFLPTDLQAQRWYGSATVFIPLVPLWVTSIITLLVWALLRLTVPLESLTDEERNRPLLRRLNYLQLFACTGTLIAAIWAVSSFFMQRLVTDAIQISGQDLINFYLFHIITIAFASALLYAGAHTRKIGLILLCFCFSS